MGVDLRFSFRRTVKVNIFELHERISRERYQFVMRNRLHSGDHSHFHLVPKSSFLYADEKPCPVNCPFILKPLILCLVFSLLSALHWLRMFVSRPVSMVVGYIQIAEHTDESTMLALCVNMVMALSLLRKVSGWVPKMPGFTDTASKVDKRVFTPIMQQVLI